MNYYQWKFLLVILAGWINRHQQDVIEYLLEENRVYRELQAGRRLRFSDRQRRRLAAAVKLLVQMARENPSWGYTKLRGTLLNLGYKMSRSTIRRILLGHGLEPTPRRTTWKAFLKTHWDQLAATDTFNVEVLTPRGLVRYTVLFVMHLSTRRVSIAGVAPDPGKEWAKNVFRAQVDEVDGFLLGKRYLILDRDPIFSEALRNFLKMIGIKPVRLPPQSPNLNAYAERFVRSIKSECLDRMIFFSEAALVRTVYQYAEHYHHERNHQGVGNQILEPGPEVGQRHGRIACRQRVGGLLKYYYRRSA